MGIFHSIIIKSKKKNVDITIKETMAKPKSFQQQAEKEADLNADSEMNQENDDEFEINDISDDDEPADDFVDIVFPCNVAICAAPISGKSSMVLSIIEDEEFDLVFVVSLTPGNSAYENVATAVLPSLSEKFLDDLFEMHEEDPELKSLLIFDDFIGSEKSGFNCKNSPAIDRISASGRHNNISMIFSSQNWVSIPVIFRRTANYYVLGANTHDINKNLSKILANGSMTPRKLFLALEKISSENRFEFIIFDRKKKDWMKTAPTIRSNCNNGVRRN